MDQMDLKGLKYIKCTEMCSNMDLEIGVELI